MQWSDVRIFLAVARCGSFGGAARALLVSHPTVRRRLRALEQKFGQVLFQPRSEGVVLTKAAEAILRLAEKMEANALAIRHRLAGVSERFELRISSVGCLAPYVLPPVLEELWRQYPWVVPKLIASHRAIDLARGEADIAFRIVPFNEPNVVQRRLMRITYGLYANRDVPAPKRGDGAGSALLLMDTSEFSYPDVAWIQEVLPRARAVFSSNCRGLLAKLCAKGLGVAVLPRPVGDQTPGLHLIDLGIEPPSRDFWVGYHRDLRQIEPLRAMADIAVRLLDPANP